MFILVKMLMSDDEPSGGDESVSVHHIGRNSNHHKHASHGHDDDEGGHGGGGGGHESDEFLWLFSFNDMLFNLLLFFIVMFAISSVNKSKFEAVAEALNYPKDAKSEGLEQPLFFKRENVETSLNDLRSQDVYVECANPLSVPTGTAVSEQNGGPGGGVAASGRQAEAEFSSKVVVLSGDEYFRPAEPEPTPRGLRLIKKLASAYKNNPKLVQIQIEGYAYLNEFTDRKLDLKSQPPSVQAWGLSAQRAASVFNLMVEEGFDANIISIMGVGPGAKEHRNAVAGGKEEMEKRPKIVIRLTETDADQRESEEDTGRSKERP